MACERFRDALADVAAGEPAPASLEAHLASCEGCRAALHVLRQALAVADAEMAGLAATEPSPDLAARIRRAVVESGAAGPAFEAWPSPAWRFGWLWPAVAAGAALLVALAVGLERGTAPAPEPRVAVDDRPSPIPSPRPADSAPPQVVPRDVARVGPEAPRAERAVAPAEPEVLVPPGEREALLRLVALVHRERMAPPGLAAAGQLSADLAEPAPIDIPPLEIVPLDPAEISGT
jgi:hypothetical protein